LLAKEVNSLVCGSHIIKQAHRPNLSSTWEDGVESVEQMAILPDISHHILSLK